MKSREYEPDLEPLESFDWSYYLPSFGVQEIYSPDLYASGVIHVHDIPALLKLQRLRDEVYKVKGCGLLVNTGSHRRRGIRSVRDHVKLIPHGASKIHSMHLTGKAFDISMTKDHDTDWLARRALEFGWGSVGRYYSFVHIDDRRPINGVPHQWDNRVTRR